MDLGLQEVDVAKLVEKHHVDPAGDQVGIAVPGRYTRVYPKRVKRSSGFCGILEWVEQAVTGA
ncbi:hypothetical protein ACYZT4_04045 [Pseudomonas sp. GB2N2]